jgi:hypothetical protein
MKKLVIILITAIFLVGCTSQVNNTTTLPSKITQKESSSPVLSSTNPQEESMPRDIPVVRGLTADDISAIWQFDDSRPPDTPAYMLYKEKDIKAMLESLQAVRLTASVGPLSSMAAGDGWIYRIYFFNGNSREIVFNSHGVYVDGELYACEDGCQELRIGVPEPVRVLSDDSYDTVNRVEITDAQGKRSVTDHEEIVKVVRMFQNITVYARSHDTVEGADEYIFYYKDGSKHHFKLKGDLLATDDGMYSIYMESVRD